MILQGYHIRKAYFVTKKRHINRPNELKFINAEVTKESGDRVEVYLDSTFLGTVPYSKESKIIKDGDNFTIELYIDKPVNLDSNPFRYQMKMYHLFGNRFVINSGNKNHEVYKHKEEKKSNGGLVYI